MGSSLVRWLATLDADRLAEILARRPDVRTSAVRDLSQLAGRLQSHDSVGIAFQGLPRPAIQLVEVLQSIGGPAVGRERLATALGRTPKDPDLDATLRILAQRALVWLDPDDRALHLAGPLWSAFPYPLRLGAPAEQLLQPLPATQLRDMAVALDTPAGRYKKDTLRAVCRQLADAGAVRDLVESAPETVRKLLVETAWSGPLVAAAHSPYGYGRPSPEVGWATARGLLVHDGWRHAQMPAEVARALRGPQWRPRFDPRPPSPDVVDADPQAVAREAAAAAGTAVEQVAALLDACAAAPAAVLKSGGVGVRELRRLGKAVGCGEPEVRLWLELGYAAGLVAQVREQVLPTEAYDSWSTAEPPARLVTLLHAWLRLPAAPLAGPGPEGGSAPAALTRDPSGPHAYELRPQVLAIVAERPEGQGVTGAKSIESVLSWRTPLLIGAVSDGEALVSGVWREAHLLGVLAHGALTPLGRALLNESSLDETAERLLPAAVRTAMFQADLTAVVPGVPAADLAALLDGAADRESRGGAATWRFSAASVRRALDAGRDRAALVAELREFAAGGVLPQPLEYLVGDVARRHGAIRARSVGCVLHADDPALLAELASARALTSLKLSVLAPTVLVSAAPVDETLKALRAAGYAPVGESADGTALIERAPRQRAPVRRRTPARSPSPSPSRSSSSSSSSAKGAAVDPRQLAEALLAAPLLAMADPPDEAAASIAQYAAQLSDHERALLRAAVETGAPVEIGYTNAQGSSSTRVVEPIDLGEHLLVAWCQLREDERVFSLDRISFVASR